MEYRKLLKFIKLAPIALLLLFASFWFANWVTLNFHEITPHQVYRSRQLNSSELAHLQSHYHFRTIINLRGKQAQASWYQAEMAFVRSQHIRHYDFSFSAHKLPSWQKLSALVSVLQTAPRPLLLHCREGADRTGLASAVSYLLSGESKSAVQAQLSYQYNVLSPSTVGYQVMQNYLGWLKHSRLSFGKQSFLQWVKQRPKLTPRFGWYL